MLSYERIGNNHYVYKNGTLEDTGSTANRPDNGIFSIGESGFGDFNGYLDEFRVSDVARYSGASFTEPTEAFTFDSDTQFLLHFDGADGSTVIKSADDTLFQGTFSEGQVVPENKTEVPVSMDAITMTLGDFTLIQGTTESPTGQELTGSIGQVDAIHIVDVSGIESSTTIGSVFVSVSNTPEITGISMTATAGNLIGNAWAEIDPGVNNTWSDIDPGVNNTWSDVDKAA